jgi:histidinol-phosphate aminotransferase
MERMIIMDRNENNYGPAPKCHEVMDGITMEYFSTYSRDYPRRIKSRIAEQYGISQDGLVIGYGAEDLLKQLIYWAGRPGAKIAVPNMSWWYYKHIVAETKAELIEYKMVESDDSWDFDDDEILAILRKKPDIFIIASPNNPTGNYLDQARIHKYLEAKSPSTLFIIDEAYWGFGAPPFSEREVAGYDNLVVLRTLSKYYALAGLRIGFAFLGRGLEGFVTYNSKYLGFNRISEEMLFAALSEESAPYYREKAAMIVEDGRMLVRELDALGFKAFKSCANFVLARLPHGDFEMLREKIQARGIVIKFFTEPIFEDCVRITIGTREQNELLVSIMKELLRKKAGS